MNRKLLLFVKNRNIFYVLLLTPYNSITEKIIIDGFSWPRSDQVEFHFPWNWVKLERVVENRSSRNMPMAQSKTRVL